MAEPTSHTPDDTDAFGLEEELGGRRPPTLDATEDLETIGGPAPDDGRSPPLPHDGYCLFTAGAAGVGKSTLQHALIHRLHTDENIQFKLRNTEGLEHQDPALQEWIYRFDRGEFPERTPRGTLQTFFVEFGQRRPLARLSFVEISGEHFQAILPDSATPGRLPELHQDLEYILTSERVKKLFVFVADAARHQGRKDDEDAAQGDRDQALYEDMLFSRLLAWVKSVGVKRIRLLFAAAKWDAVRYRNLDPENFFRKHFPQTRAELKTFETAKVYYVRFSIGEIETRSEESRQVMQIVQHNYQPIERLINWIHINATGRRLKGYPPIEPTLWERIKRWAA